MGSERSAICSVVRDRCSAILCVKGDFRTSSNVMCGLFALTQNRFMIFPQVTLFFESNKCETILIEEKARSIKIRNVFLQF